MNSSARSNSPILKRLGGENRRQREREWITDEEKIHRIVLSGSSAICKLAHVQSPNCMWFKLHNHITDQLQIHLSEPLSALELIKTPAEGRNAKRRHESGETPSSEDEGVGSSLSSPFSSEIQLYKYVMAPLEENVYARGRVTQLVEVVNARSERSYQFAYVHFIDEGYGAWMNSECLAKMDSQLYWHPWQAFSISLFKFGCFPCLTKKSVWPVGLTERLELIMTEYDTFRVEPVWESRPFSERTYSDYVRANVYGVVSEDDEKRECTEESIAHRLALESTLLHRLENKLTVPDSNNGFLPSSFFTRTIFDATQQTLFCEPSEELTDDMLSGGIPRWRFVKPRFV